jgi:hypothetical protein
LMAGKRIKVIRIQIFYPLDIFKVWIHVYLLKNVWINHVYIQYTYIVGKYKIYLYEL